MKKTVIFFALFIVALLNSALILRPAPESFDKTQTELTVAQTSYVYSIRVLDADTGEPILGATVMACYGKLGNWFGTVTDEDGNATLTGTMRFYKVKVSYMGYVTQELAVGDITEFTVRLKPV